MAIFKCKMCGGALEISSETVATCEYCGTKQTLPKLDGDRKVNLYDRASHFRRNNEFDKAMGIYEQILNEDTTDAEAYWSLVLCRYGIEYVEDPASKKRLPTVNRAQFTSVFDDDNYKSALHYADESQKAIYEAEAHAINEIQKEILEISQKEKPFDVFICYKESDNNGRRTPDSVLATELYHELCKEGFKVFFSRITLEDKLGTAYEPYIFAALNSAKVMVVLGTKQEYFNAVWVKNEWSRYLALIKNGAEKVLIPAYRDMDPYDLPEEFSHLQAQDMSKLGFMQDLVRGIRKIAGEEKAETVIKETIVSAAPVNVNASALLERAFMFLEDGEWAKADEFCEQVLNIEPKNAEAYLGKLMAELKVKTRDTLKDYAQPFDSYNNYQKVIKFADSKLKSEVESITDFIISRNKEAEMSSTYNKATEAMNSAQTSQEFEQAANLFDYISDYKDSKKLAEICKEKQLKAEADEKEAELSKKYNYALSLSRGINETKLEAAAAFEELGDYKDSQKKATALKDEVYNQGKALLDSGSYTSAIKHFELLDGYKDSQQLREECKKRKLELAKKEEARNKKNVIIIISAILSLAILLIIYASVIDPAINYSKAQKHFEKKEYSEAASLYEKLGNRKDSPERLEEAKYNYALQLAEKGEKAKAAIMLYGISNYKDAKAKSFALWAEVAPAKTLDVGDDHTVALKNDGTLIAVGDNDYNQCDVSSWSDIIAISANTYHTVGLKSNHTVITTKDDSSSYVSSREEVSDWTDIVAVSAGKFITAGLKADGTVVTTDDEPLAWTNIIAVSAGDNVIVGLTVDGTVVATDRGDDDDEYKISKVSEWTDIVAIACTEYDEIWGIKSDGTVVSTDFNTKKTDLANVVSMDPDYFVKSDGTVECIYDGYNSYENFYDITDEWTDIVAVAKGSLFAVGLKSDGTVITTGYSGFRNNYDGQCYVDEMTDIKLP